MERQPGDDESELAGAFEVLLIAQKVGSVSENEEFPIRLPDVVPDWAADEEPIHSNHQLYWDRPAADDLEQTSLNTERAAPPGRVIRRASRRSSILRLPGASSESSTECSLAGPSQTKITIERTAPSSEETSKNATVNPDVDVGASSDKVPFKDSAVPKVKRASSDRTKEGSIKLEKTDSGKSSSKPAPPTCNLPLAEQMQRYFNEVPSRFRSFPTKRANNQPTVAAKRKSVAVRTPVPGRSSTELKEKESKKSEGDSKIFQPPNLTKVSTKFTSSSHPIKPDLHKFAARSVPRQSSASLPRAPSRASVVFEECNGKTEKKLINTHVGVPQSECSGVRKLVVKPFSFVERNERARKMREEKLRQALEESVSFPKFKANPLPSYLTEKTNTEASSSKHLPKAEQLNKKGEKENLPSH